ncbi:MAG: hypothetical protein WCD18_22765 [Thermosynechococcaceae cyanobacterium]
MLRNKVLTHSLLASIALVTFTQSFKAEAKPIWVQRGSHGAVQVVESDRLPIGTTALPTGSGHHYPNLVSKGSHGAVTFAAQGDSGGTKMSETHQPAKQSMVVPHPSKTGGTTLMFQSAHRFSADELLTITNPLI